jgi:O-antigen/teichoic acid export membrane protein
MTVISPTRTFRLFFRASESKDLRHRRLVGIIQGVVGGLGNKIVGMLVSLLSVPLTIHYLGPERYGAWVTLGSLLAWLNLTDFGLGNGFTNAVTTAAAQERPELVRTHVSNAVLLLSAIALTTGIAAIVVWPYINWSSLLGVTSSTARSEIGYAAAAALAIFLLQFPLAITGRIYLAYQEGRIAGYWGVASNLLTLVAIIIVTRTRGGLVWLVIAISGASLVVSLTSTLWVFFYHRPFLAPKLKHIDFHSMGALSQIGSQFFLIQIMALVTFQTDNLVISHYLGAARVPEYSLTYNLFAYTSLPQAMLFSYLWAAYTEAIARKDIAWVARTFRLNLGIGLLFTGLTALILASFVKPFIGWWASHAVIPSSALIAWMAAWSVINALTNPTACLLAAASHLRAQIVYSGLATVSNIVLSLYLVQRWGVSGVIAATVISYALWVCVPVYVDAEILLKRLRHAV